MKCPTCKSDMALLFTSTYCPTCEGSRVNSEPTLYFGYFKSHIPTREITPGYVGMVFETVEGARDHSLYPSYVTKVASNKPLLYWPHRNLYRVVEGFSLSSEGLWEITVVGEA